jgi:hypothetical protein
MSSRKKLVDELVKLTSLDINSDIKLRITTEQILGLAFRTPKPLFTSSCGLSKSAVGKLLEQALPLLDRSIHHFSLALELELREYAKVYRSGLQYLVDEFKDEPQVYDKLKQILSADSVVRVEEYLTNNRDAEPEYTISTEYLSTSDRKQIIPSHTWWF